MLVDHERTPTTWTVANELRAVERLRRKLTRLAPGLIECCYEAGPCGYALYRQLHLGRVRCHVIAGSFAVPCGSATRAPLAHHGLVRERVRT